MLFRSKNSNDNTAKIADSIRLKAAEIKDAVVVSSAYVSTMKAEASGISMNIYQLIDGKPGFTITKPETSNKNILLSIAASFTGKDLASIMGQHVVDGVKMSGYGKPNGYCVILGKKMLIKEASDSLQYYTDKAVSDKGDLFRQELLVINGEAVPCKLFKAAVPLRAIAIYKGLPTVIETDGAATISDFTKALVTLGVSDALYADMGGWSYGWYRDKDGKNTHLGVLTPNTNNQTNWFVFEK